MPDRLTERRVKKILMKFIRGVQKVLIVILLTVVYFAGFGLTVVFLLIFNPRVIRGDRKRNSSWIRAEEPEPGLESCMRGS